MQLLRACVQAYVQLDHLTVKARAMQQTIVSSAFITKITVGSKQLLLSVSPGSVSPACTSPPLNAEGAPHSGAGATVSAHVSADKNPVLREFATEVTKIINEAVAQLENTQ